MKGLSKLEVNHQALKDDLKDKWELLAEPIQVVMRKHGIEGAYEKLKAMTRGKSVTRADVQKLVKSLKIPAADKNRLLKLTPETYVGLAEELVGDYQLDVLGMGCGGGCGGCGGCGSGL